MNAVRGLLALTAVLACCYATASLIWLTVTDFGIGVAITAACVLGLDLIRALQSDRRTP